MVVVDKLTKYGYFIAMAHPYTTVTVAHLFIEHVFKLHGMPSTIVSDRDPVFLSDFWKEFFKLQGSKFCMSLGYHPQTDGQTEVVNRDGMLALLRHNLLLAQERMQLQANNHRIDREFEVGALVYLKLIPYQFPSLNKYSFSKLHPKFYGPYEVLERIGNSAYRLKLPPKTKIHPVFHVSNLKRYLGSAVCPTTKLPMVTDEGLIQQQPRAVSQRRIYKECDIIGTQLLIQWEDHTTEESTWEDYEEFVKKFPNFVL
ncbi:uncharacterized protein LOC119992741 [Tripterygium wilfordii]|uniref:uncharacterized protein LOC119992741 n=1 Tax=Tripterygium wilfordii TaxID=458696 RepID=UPI0018F81297|nr:uncharacterized protein LOC119992741 [Tripterygium wilfordii]